MAPFPVDPMSIPAELLLTTCDVYRPFGAGAPTYTNVRCRLVDDLARGRRTGSVHPGWTHYLDLDAGADLRDGCTRVVAGVQQVYADGDEVRIPSGASAPRFVVVWVTTIDAGTPREFKRAYLMRHAA